METKHAGVETSHSLTAAIQMFCAQAALFFLPMPAIKPLGISLTVADLFLVPAVLLNLRFALRLHFFQILLLLALPLNLLSHMLDPGGDLIPLLQMVYLWGFLVPFGWCAFVTVPKERLALLLLIGSSLSSVMAMGQFAGFLPVLPTQKVIELNVAGGLRAPGLVLQCNSLAMSLTPCFLLLPSIRRASLRVAFTLILFGGIASTVSKAIVLALPGFLFYFLWREPEKRKVFGGLSVLLLLGVFVLARGEGVALSLGKLWDTIQYRLTYVDESVDDRKHLASMAIKYAGEDCWLLGFGTNGAYEHMRQDRMEQSVHVWYLGMWLVIGAPALAFTLLAFANVVLTLWRLRQFNEAIYLLAHLLAICVTTMLYISYQYAPLVIAATALVRANWEHEQRLLAERRVRVAGPTALRRA